MTVNNGVNVMQKIKKWISYKLWCLKARLYTPILWFNGFFIRAYHSIDDIPEGCYCYTTLETPSYDNGFRMKIKSCPFLDSNPLADDQSYGYCHYLKAGDWQYNGTSLLWDQCKECEENAPND